MSPPASRPGPLRSHMRKRFMTRAGLTFPDLPTQSLMVGGLERTYSIVPGPSPSAPLLVVLHGAGGTGLGMAALTGLAVRGPAAGCAVVFPDGWARVWSAQEDAPRLARRAGVDDIAFLQALSEHLQRTQVGDPARTYAIGISNGGFLAEHLARHGLLSLAGIVLVASGATVTSRQARPIPIRSVRVLAFHGSDDPLVPYIGGAIGPLGRMVQRRSARRGMPSGRGLAAPIEEVLTDWAAMGGEPRRRPKIDLQPAAPEDLGVARLTWTIGGGDGPVLYRIEGGGHTWPGGAQYLPQRIVGRVARRLDATGLILDFVHGS